MLDDKQDSSLGEYLFPSVEIKLNVFCFYVLQDFMSCVFMLYETSMFFVLCFTKLRVFYFFFMIYEISMSFVIMFYKPSMSYVFMSYRTSRSFILRFYRTTRSLFLSYKTSMSFCFMVSLFYFLCRATLNCKVDQMKLVLLYVFIRI